MPAKPNETGSALDPAIFLATSAGDTLHQQAEWAGVSYASTLETDEREPSDDPWGDFVQWSYEQDIDPSWLEE